MICVFGKVHWWEITYWLVIENMIVNSGADMQGLGLNDSNDANIG